MYVIHPFLSCFIFGAIRDSNPSASPRCSSRIGWAEPCCRRGTRKEGGVHYACGNPARARRLRRQWCGESGLVGCLERREVRMGLTELQLALGRRGWFFTMSSTGLGAAGLGGRQSGNGRSIGRAAPGCRATSAVGDISRNRWDGARQKERGFGCPLRSVGRRPTRRARRNCLDFRRQNGRRLGVFRAKDWAAQSRAAGKRPLSLA